MAKDFEQRIWIALPWLEDTDPPNFPRLLRLGGERRGEGAPSDRGQESAAF